MEAYGYLIAIIAAWFVAHVIKYVISKIQNKERSFSEQLFMSGGMPSSHSAVIMSVTTLVALREGITSPLFALSAAVTLIVIYDASHVRYMAGQTAERVNVQANSKKDAKTPIKVLRGHTPVEVAAGVVLGGLISLVVFLATQ
jgi:acid phosphatase family membrane protein YuiD